LKNVVIWEPNAGNSMEFLQLAKKRGLKKLLHVSDEAANPQFAELARHADVVLGTGDFYDPIWSATCPVFYVFGNHDNPAELAGHFVNRPDADVHRRIVEVQGLRIGGVGGCLPYKHHQRGQLTEEEFEEAFAGLARWTSC